MAVDFEGSGTYCLVVTGVESFQLNFYTKGVEPHFLDCLGNIGVDFAGVETEGNGWESGSTGISGFGEELVNLTLK